MFMFESAVRGFGLGSRQLFQTEPIPARLRLIAASSFIWNRLFSCLNWFTQTVKLSELSNLTGLLRIFTRRHGPIAPLAMSTDKRGWGVSTI